MRVAGMVNYKNFSHLKIMLSLYVMLCTIWYHLYNLKNVKNIHVGILLLVTLLLGCFSHFLNCTACNFTKSNILSWVFITFFKLYKWYLTAQRASYKNQSIDFQCSANKLSSFYIMIKLALSGLRK